MKLIWSYSSFSLGSTVVTQSVQRTKSRKRVNKLLGFITLNKNHIFTSGRNPPWPQAPSSWFKVNFSLEATSVALITWSTRTWKSLDNLWNLKWFLWCQQNQAGILDGSSHRPSPALSRLKTSAQTKQFISALLHPTHYDKTAEISPVLDSVFMVWHFQAHLLLWNSDSVSVAYTDSSKRTNYTTKACDLQVYVFTKTFQHLNHFSSLMHLNRNVVFWILVYFLMQ